MMKLLQSRPLLLMCLGLLFTGYSNLGSAESASRPLDHYPQITNAAKDLVTDLDRRTKVLSQFESAQIQRHIQDARDTVAQRRGYSGVLCLPSISEKGKFCMKAVSGETTCVGNYFDTATSCKASLATARDQRACYQSSSKPGKALISTIQQTSSLIGNYYSNFDSCVLSMRYSYGSLVCMESARNIGQWFIANLDQNAAQVGGYQKSFGDCARDLGFDYQDPIKYLTKPSEIDSLYSMVGLPRNFDWGGGKEFWIAIEKVNQFGAKFLFIRENGDVYAWDGRDAKGFLASGKPFGSAKIAEVNPAFYKAVQLLIDGKDDPTLPVNLLHTLASEVVHSVGLGGSGGTFNWGGGNEYWIFTKSATVTGQRWVYLLPSGELWAWDALDKKGFLSSGTAPKSKKIAQLNTLYYRDIPLLVAGIDYPADVDRKYELTGDVTFKNWGGLNEKWIKGKALDLGDKYFILPSGDVYLWSNADTKAVFASLKNSRKVGKVDKAYYNNPKALTNAAP